MKKKETRKERRENREAARELKQQSRRNDLLRAISGSLLMVALGILLLLRPDFGTRTVASVLGWILIVGGGVCIAVSLLNRDVLGWSELLVGIVLAALGFFIVIKPETLVRAFGVIIGIYTVIHGVISLLEGLKLRKLGYGGTVSLVLGAGMTLLGIAMIFVPAGFSNLLMRIFGGGLVLCGSVNLFSRTVAESLLRKPKTTEENED